MIYQIKKLLTALIPFRLKQIIINENNDFKNNSYSQEGEDLILDKFLTYKRKGFYIDIGAHHPKRFSNTYLYYKRGWRGINIDALPGSMIEFQKQRNQDINLEIGISKTSDKQIFYIFNEPALNTFDKELAYSKNGTNGNYITKQLNVQTSPLSQILDNYLPENVKNIDFMSIDVEGLELLVLESNDWNKYKPQFLLVEELNNCLNIMIKESAVLKFLEERNYTLIAKTFNTSFYKLNE
ncbi:MAG: SAM-dependent methyltransferase [Burkholderiales bacterium PBB4]|nr:MAG: SAM-dependent methyltransferase [Burkholderiales bacterium PBB4]